LFATSGPVAKSITTVTIAKVVNIAVLLFENIEVLSSDITYKTLGYLFY